MRQPAMTAAEVKDYLIEVFPQTAHLFEIDEIAPMRARVRMLTGPEHLRPGGTVSGPTLFTLADCAFYVATLAMIGRVALTVTTNCSINFMRKPAPGALVCEARILKLGKLLSVGDATIWSEGASEPAAHAALTYAIPPGRGENVG
ncbi:PaaI family thioesterase [Oceanicella actignis]|uniref:PaaI family thioesterase n=1 Tax=Oceanicella actignis TaxID=1189325 RepID=UPI001253D575|nr:PaaI family thioesterase [Oceanicella actignis]TYO85238.1 uncharacterized protein (TIGR00369 family) [Oceanicella actignis]